MAKDTTSIWDNVYDHYPTDQVDLHSPLADEIATLFCTLYPHKEERSRIRLLEAGSGSGELSARLALEGFSVTLLDQSEVALNVSKTIFQQHNIQGTFISGNLFSMPFDGESFDCVWNSGVIEHYVGEEQKEAMAEMARVSKNYVTIAIPNSRCLFYRIQKLHLESEGRWIYDHEFPLPNLTEQWKELGYTDEATYHMGSGITQQWLEQALESPTAPFLGKLSALLEMAGKEFEDIMSYLVVSVVSKAGTLKKTTPTTTTPQIADPNIIQEQQHIITSLNETIKVLRQTLQHTQEEKQQLQQDIDKQEKQHRQLQEEYKKHMEDNEAQRIILKEELETLHQEHHTLALHATHLKQDLETTQQAMEQYKEASAFHQKTIEDMRRSITWKILLTFQKLSYLIRHPLHGSFLIGKRLFPYLPAPLQRLAIAGYGLIQRSSSVTPPTTTSLTTPVWVGEVPGLVSIILPLYNQADTLKDSIESILHQTYKDWELIIINDGSTDHTVDVLNEYASHPRIRIFHQPNQKLPKALTNGFLHARGEWYCWTSGDNIMEPTSLEKQVDFLQKHQDTHMVYTDYMIIDDRGQPLTGSDFRLHNQSPVGSADIRLPRHTSQLNTTQDNFIGPSFLYRAWVARIIGPYDPALGVEDYDYWMRINSLFTIRHLGTDDILYRYRVHDNSLSAQAKELKILEKAQALINYDKQRRAYFAQPWSIDTAHISPETKEHLHLPETLSRQYDKHITLLEWSEDLDLKKYKESEHSWLGVLISAPLTPFSNISNLHQADAVFTLHKESYGVAHHMFRERTICIADPACAWEIIQKTANSFSFWKKTKRPEEVHLLPALPHASQEPLPILIMTPGLDKGGLEQVIYDIVTHLDRKKFTPVVLCTKKKGLLAERCEEQGIPVILLQSPGEAHFRSILQKYQIKRVNVHHLDMDREDFPEFGGSICHEYNIPIISFLHNMYAWYGDREKNFTRSYDRYVSHYIAVSKNVAWYAHTHIGLPYTKISIIPNGIDLSQIQHSTLPNPRSRSEFGIGESDILFLHIASYYGIKGHHALISAAATLKKEQPPPFKILCLGHTFDTGHADSFKRRIQKEGLEECVLLPGFYEDVHHFYPLADCFILPSFYEGWSISMMEAMAHGLPLIMTDVGGAREVIQEHDIGILIPGLTNTIQDLGQDIVYRHALAHHLPYEQQLIDAMKEMIVNADLRKSMGKHAFQKVQQFALQNIIPHYEYLFTYPYEHRAYPDHE